MSDMSSQPVSGTPQPQPTEPGKEDIGRQKKDQLLPNATREIQSLPPAEQQKAVMLAVLIHALIQSLVVGSNAMIARSKGLGNINQMINQLNDIIAKDKLTQIESIHITVHRKYVAARARHTDINIQTNRGAISMEQTQNQEIMHRQSVINQRINTLQQQSETGDSEESAAMEALEMVANEIHTTLTLTKQTTYDAVLTKQAQG